MMPFFHFFHISGAGNWLNTVQKCLVVDSTSCNLLMWSRCGGKWFILYQSNKHYFIWAMIWCPFFHFSHISGAGNWLRTKELNLKMSCGRKCGGKSCSPACLWVENSFCPKMSLFGKYLSVENVSPWKIPHDGKCFMVQKVVTKTYSITAIYFFIKKDLNKRHKHTIDNI